MSENVRTELLALKSEMRDLAEENPRLKAQMLMQAKWIQRLDERIDYHHPVEHIEIKAPEAPGNEKFRGPVP